MTRPAATALHLPSPRRGGQLHLERHPGEPVFAPVFRFGVPVAFHALVQVGTPVPGAPAPVGRVSELVGPDCPPDRLAELGLNAARAAITAVTGGLADRRLLLDLPPLPLAVHLGYVCDLRDAVAAGDTDAAQLVLLVHEAQADLADAARALAPLRAAGAQVGLAGVDDPQDCALGCEVLRPEWVVLDRGMVTRLPSSRSADRLDALLRVADCCDAEVVAPHVDTREQARLLHRAGVEHLQGLHPQALHEARSRADALLRADTAAAQPLGSAGLLGALALADDLQRRDRLSAALLAEHLARQDRIRAAPDPGPSS